MEHLEEKPKRVLLKNKYIILIIVIGCLVTRIGALGKISSVPWGNMLLTYGLLIQIVGYILGVVKLLSIKQVKSFLNS